MKKTALFGLCVLVSALSAADNSKSPLIANFFESVPIAKQEMYKKHLNTPLQQEAMEYITNPAKMYLGTAPAGADPHTKKGVQKTENRIPNWVEAVKYMHQSTVKESNPISANAGITIIKSYLGKNNKDYLVMYREMTEFLSSQKNCNGLIEHSDMLEQGIGMAKNQKKALELLNVAKKECSGIQGKWQKTAIDLRVNRLELFLNAKK